MLRDLPAIRRRFLKGDHVIDTAGVEYRCTGDAGSRLVHVERVDGKALSTGQLQGGVFVRYLTLIDKPAAPAPTRPQTPEQEFLGEE